MKHTRLKISAIVAVIGLSYGLPSYAAGTVAGTAVNNKATVSYSVGGTAQTPIESSPTGNATAGTGNGTNTQFLVDRQLAVTVTPQDAAQTVSVSPGQTAAVQKFVVTNTGNGTQDFLLEALQQATGATGNGTGTDAFDATNTKVFVDTNGDGVYTAGTDTQLFIDELAPDATKTVFVVSNIPLGQTSGQAAKIALVAQVATGGTAGTEGAAITSDTNGHVSPAGVYDNGATTVAAGTATTTADVAGTVQNVFRDLANEVNSQNAADTASNGQYSEIETYLVASATLTITKTSKVISDPVNGTTNPKAIPGAVVEYCIIVANTGTTAATPVSIADPLPTQTTYAAGTIKSGVTVNAGVCDNTTGTAVTDAAGYAAGPPATVTVAIPAGVPAATTTAALFRATIN